MKMNIIKKIVIATLASSIVMCFAGCSVDQENKTVFKLSSNGTIEQTIVDDNNINATGEDLETFINGEISDMGSTDQKDTVSLENCVESEGKINIDLKYSSADAYAQFNSVKCFNGTLKEAADSGYDFCYQFYAVNGASIPYYTLPALYYDYNVLIVEEAMTVKLPGELVAYSSGITVEDDGTITVDENFDQSIDERLRTVVSSPVFLIYK